MKHLTIRERGRFLGVTGSRLVIQDKDIIVAEITLNRLKTITIAKDGVTLSSNLLMACAERGIQVFFVDFRGMHLSSLQGFHHRVAKLRAHQFDCLKQPMIANIAEQMIIGKLRNQRAVLLYFAKGNDSCKNSLRTSAEQIKGIIEEIKTYQWAGRSAWRNELLGYEGSGARIYWHSLKEVGLLTSTFLGRSGRNADDIMNKLLNYGYAILSSWIWQAISNAGLEPFAGVLHTQRAGKPSLVLDMMEEFRAWCVDRTVVKMRGDAEGKSDLTPALKKRLIDELHTIYQKHYPYHGRKLRLESIIQRQAYRIAGVFAEQKRYKSYVFKW